MSVSRIPLITPEDLTKPLIVTSSRLAISRSGCRRS